MWQELRKSGKKVQKRGYFDYFFFAKKGCFSIKNGYKNGGCFLGHFLIKFRPQKKGGQN